MKVKDAKELLSKLDDNLELCRKDSQSDYIEVIELVQTEVYKFDKRNKKKVIMVQ